MKGRGTYPPSFGQSLAHYRLKCGLQLALASKPDPLFQHVPCPVQQEQVRLILIAELRFERSRIWIVDIQVYKIDLA